MKTIFVVITLVFVGQFSFAMPTCRSQDIDIAADHVATLWNAAKSTISLKPVSNSFTKRWAVSWSVPDSIYGDHVDMHISIPCANSGKNDDCYVNYLWADEAKMEKPGPTVTAARLWGKGAYSSFCNVNVTQNASPELRLLAGQCSCGISINNVAKGWNGKFVFADYYVDYKLVPLGNSYELRAGGIAYTGGTPPWKEIQATSV